MNIGQNIINLIENYRDKKRKTQTGSIGQFWRDGGKKLLYELPVLTGELVIDAGGYQGEWTAEMISRYGCRSQIFEPVPEFYEHCQSFFKDNNLVQVHNAALGRDDRKAKFNLLKEGTSEFRVGNNSHQIESDVIDVSRIFNETDTQIACFKLNIEGGEYDVLERMIETNDIARCGSLLIQFHRQPDAYYTRYKNLIKGLQKSHNRIWFYEMVWEKWVRKTI